MEMMTAEGRRRVQAALTNTLAAGAKVDAKRLYSKPEGITETEYNNDVMQRRAFHRRHACRLSYALLTNISPVGMNAHLIFT